jgi:hypothetical protein
MRYVASALLVLSTGLWIGGIVALAMFAMTVFKALDPDRATAGVATSAMFVLFSKYQLVLAAVSLFAAFLAYLQDRRRVYTAIFALLALAAVGAVAYSLHYIPRMEEIRKAGEATGDAFKAMHRQVSTLFQVILALVLGGVLLIPKVTRPPTRVTAPSNG